MSESDSTTETSQWSSSSISGEQIELPRRISTTSQRGNRNPLVGDFGNGMRNQEEGMRNQEEGMRNLETSINELEERVVSLQKQINLFLALLCSLTFLFSLTLINFLWIFIPSYLGTELPPFLETFYEYASWGITPWFGALTAACFVYNRFFFEYAFNPFIVHNCVFFDCQSPVVRRIVQRMFLYLMFPTFIYAIFDIMYVLMLGIFFVSLALSLWYFGSLLIYFIFGSFLLYLVVMIGESRFVLSNSGYFTLLYRAVVM